MSGSTARICQSGAGSPASSSPQPAVGTRGRSPEASPQKSQPRSTRQGQTQPKPPPSSSLQTQPPKPATCDQSWQPFRSRYSSSCRHRWPTSAAAASRRRPATQWSRSPQQSPQAGRQPQHSWSQSRASSPRSQHRRSSRNSRQGGRACAQGWVKAEPVSVLS